MIAWDPFRINKGCGTALHWDTKFGMNYILGRVRQVYMDRFYAGLTKCGLSLEQSRCNGESYASSD
jgi:hypothetical protein